MEGPPPATFAQLPEMFGNILSIALRLIGVAVFVMFIVGGFKWVTSGGDPKKLQAAQATLTYAIMGLVLALLAWFILVFIEKFTGVNVTEFRVTL